MRYVLMLLIMAIIWNGCGQGTSAPSPVNHAGAMKQVMMEGNISPVLSTDSVEFENLYALGAMGNLKGEILVWNGQPYLSQQQNGQLVLDDSRQFNATLWVGAQVPKWQEITLASLPAKSNLIDVMMAKSAQQKGWDGQSPFPFRLEGKFEKLAYHVINWPEGDTVHTHEKHRSSGIRDTLIHVEAQLLGFYSKQHHGVFTHHGSNVHIHFKTKDGQIAGHVDDFEPGTELKMFLPEQFE